MAVFATIAAMNGNTTKFDNPFRFGKEVSGDWFYDRTEALEHLFRTISGGSANVVLYAPRRYGKTSLVKKALERLRDEGFTGIYFDLMKVESLQKFCEGYAAAVAETSPKGEKTLQTIASYLSRLRPKFSLGDSGTPSVEFDFAATPPTASSLEDVLNLPEKTAGKRTFVVVFDEFQEIAALSPSFPLEGIFRGCIQQHKHVRYVFLGSKTHLMKRMFGNHARPFYASAEILRLDKPPIEESARFVIDRFASVGISVEEKALQAILVGSENIPYYLQALSARLFDRIRGSGRKQVCHSDVEEALEDLVQSKTDLFETILQTLTPSQRMLLGALAKEPASRFTETYRRRHGLGVSSSVHSALDVLVEQGLVESVGKTYSIGDPVFARYLRSSFFELISK